MTLPNDNPIASPDYDVLGRAPIAEAFADHVLSLDPSEGVVVGVLGAWGSGKTSFLNLALPHLSSAGATVVEFNPWMFSGAQQLVDSFFVEVSAQLKLKSGMEVIAGRLQDYGEAFSGLGWIPIVGPWIERGRGATKVLGELLQRRREGVGQRREVLVEPLKELATPLVVVLDDIDRLTTSEIRDVFKLVRLTASFPNVIYLLAFDRARVESALQEDGIPGRDYLEKILQLQLDLPAVPAGLLDQQASQALEAALSGVELLGPFDENVWVDLFFEIVRPLIRNMRDVRRYATSVRGTVAALDGQVALADVLALEAVRIFLPETFGMLHASIDGLTSTSDGFGRNDEPPHLETSVKALIESDPGHVEVVQAMIQRLFPAASRHIGGSHYASEWKKAWLRDRRTAHDEILRFYLERVVGEGLGAFNDASYAWKLMSDRDAFDGYLRSLDSDRLESVIAALENYETEFQPEQVVPGSVVLLNLLPELPDRPIGMFSFGPRLVVGRVTYRLLRSLESPELISEAVREMLPQIAMLSSKLEVITDVGYRDGAGHKLVSEELATELERAWRDEVRLAAVEELVNDPDLLKVMLVAKRGVMEGEQPFEIADSPELTLAILSAGLTEVKSQLVGNRAVVRCFRLQWEALVEIFGSEEILKSRFESMKDATVPAPDGLVAEVEKYLGGWRPDQD